MGRPFIVKGDRTSHGGEVVSGSPFTDIEGKAVARIGDLVTCPKKGHGPVTRIVTGDPTDIIDGQPVARHGDVTACGAMLISSQMLTTVEDGGGDAKPRMYANRSIQTASSTPGITAEEAQPLKEQTKEEEKKGFVVVFVNNNGRVTGEHTSVFIGEMNGKSRILYDPCGSYDKGKSEGGLGTRGGDVLGAEEFDYAGYYNYHKEDGPDIRIFPFRITKEEENKIRERVSSDEFLSSCDFDCTVRTRAVLTGIGPFKKLKPSGRFLRRTPKSLADDMGAIKKDMEKESRE
jgi:uncharacterized Zn-binding protein involved in type VI secretion